jgi:excinuclease ABC subunit C
VDIYEKLKDLPSKPGVYMMLDENGEIIYVGKAKSLKNRVRQYFHSGSKDLKTMTMVSRIRDFRYIIAASEVDALVLENNLIKKHVPKYNILLKDDKSYPFIKINLKDTYPRIDITRNLRKDGAKYFGPYMQGISAKELTELIQSAYPVRSCKENLDKKRPKRPCLNYHIGRCAAPCTERISAEDYRVIIENVISFLKGNDKNIEAVLTEKMKRFAAEYNFELAMQYRDRLKTLDKIVRKQIAALPQDFNLDVFAEVSDGVNGAVSTIIVRGGKIVGGENCSWESGFESQIGSFISQYYSINALLCDEVVTGETPEAEVLNEFLSEKAGRKISLVFPKQGVRKQLLEMAENNALDYLSNSKVRSDRTYDRTTGAVKQLAELLKLPVLPMRIEAYDISHISGTDKVASMTVFKGGAPARKHYRKFKIKTVQGSNDFMCMKEVLTRRLNRLNDAEQEDESFIETPDLLLIDGGKGQLSFVRQAMEECGRTDIAVLALAKREEEVFLDKEPIILPENSLALQLLQRVRDEAHRFAVTFHRDLRNKRMQMTELTKIEGLGDRRATALLAQFKSTAKIKEASAEEIAGVKGISLALAEKIFGYFHGSSSTKTSDAEADETDSDNVPD